MVRNGIKGRKLYSLGDDAVEDSGVLLDEGAKPLFNDGTGWIICMSAHLRVLLLPPENKEQQQ